MKIFISVHWQAKTLNYEVVPSLLMTLCAERVVCCVATRCLRHNNGHDAVPFNSVLWALLWDFWLFQSSDGFDNSKINNQSRGKKSGSVSKATDQIKKVLDWPHYHVTKGVNMEPADYEDLSWEEFVLGFVRMLRDPDCEFDVAILLEILENLLEDSIDF